MSYKAKGLVLIAVWLLGCFVMFGTLKYYALESNYLAGDIQEYEKVLNWGYTPGLVIYSSLWPMTGFSFALWALFEGLSDDPCLRIGFALTENIIYPKRRLPQSYKSI